MEVVKKIPVKGSKMGTGILTQVVKWVHEPFPLDKSWKLMKLMLLNVKSLQISVDFEFHCEGKPVSYCIHSDISSREHRHPGGLFLVAPGEVSVVVPNDFSSSLT